MNEDINQICNIEIVNEWVDGRMKPTYKQDEERIAEDRRIAGNK